MIDVEHIRISFLPKRPERRRENERPILNNYEVDEEDGMGLLVEDLTWGDVECYFRLRR
jgi:hypothetical protein